MNKTLFILACIFAYFIFSLRISGQSKVGSPFDNLPENMERHTTFGGRADFSPDGKMIIFDIWKGTKHNDSVSEGLVLMKL